MSDQEKSKVDKALSDAGGFNLSWDAQQLAKSYHAIKDLEDLLPPWVELGFSGSTPILRCTHNPEKPEENWLEFYKTLRLKGCILMRKEVEANQITMTLNHLDAVFVLFVSLPFCKFEKVGEKPGPTIPIYKIDCGGKDLPLPEDEVAETSLVENLDAFS